MDDEPLLAGGIYIIRWIMKLLLLFLLFLIPTTVLADVRKSGSEICHEQGVSPYYKKVGKKRVFYTLEACLASSPKARLPKGIKAGKQAQSRMSQMDKAHQEAKQEGRALTQMYNRELYPHWRNNVDGCLNMRHALLKQTSLISPTIKNCKVVAGKWYGRYTNQYFTNPKALDLDHVIPLFAGHKFGLHSVNLRTREAFANDRNNVLLVEAGVNRAKGSKSLSEWLPPHHPYRCEYIKKFTSIKQQYNLSYPPAEQRIVNSLKRACGLNI
jgi:hypothetical protein